MGTRTASAALVLLVLAGRARAQTPADEARGLRDWTVKSPPIGPKRNLTVELGSLAVLAAAAFVLSRARR